MNFVRSNNVSLKYQRFATLGSKDIGIINSEFVAKTQFLYILTFYLPWNGKPVMRNNYLIYDEMTLEIELFL